MKHSILCALFATSLIISCGGKQAAPAQPASETPARRTMAQGECERAGGSIVGDIGDGATQRPDYVCGNGKAPLGNVAPAAGAIAVEGTVCCPG